MNRTPDSRRVTRLAFAEYVLIGVGAVIFAPVLPRIIEDFGLSLTVAALLFPAKSAGGFAGGLAAGPLIDRFGARPVLTGCVVTAALGLLVIAFGTTWTLVLLGFTLSDIGQRALSTCLNTLVAAANPEDPGRYLNYLHGTYGAGALIAPLLIGAWLLEEADWRIIFAVAALLWCVMLLFSLRVTFPDAERSSRAGRRPAFDAKLFRNALFLLLFAVAFCYNGVAVPLLGWIKTYLDQAGTVHPFWSTSMISVFYAALTAGRFTCGAVAKRFGFERTILLCALGAAAAYPIVVFSAHPLPLAFGVLLCGLFLSGLFPTALAIANTAFADRPGTATAVLATAMTLGSLLPPWWTGAIADVATFQTALAVNSGLVVLLVCAAFAVYVRARRRPLGAEQGAVPR